MDINDCVGSFHDRSEEKSSTINHQQVEENLFSLVSIYRKRLQSAEEHANNLKIALSMLRKSNQTLTSQGCKHTDNKMDMKKYYENEIEVLRYNLKNMLTDKIQQSKQIDEMNSKIKQLMDENQEMKKGLEEKEKELGELKNMRDQDKQNSEETLEFLEKGPISSKQDVENLSQMFVENEKSQTLEFTEGEKVPEETEIVGESSETSDTLVLETPNEDELLTTPEMLKVGSEERRKMIQRQLLIILHAKQCQEPQVDHVDGQENCASKCPVAHCTLMKKVLTHMKSCNDCNCSYDHCISSKSIMAHWDLCLRKNCPICEPVRERKISVF